MGVLVDTVTTVVAGGRVDADWIDLLERHPDRFVLGSDGFGAPDQQPGLLGQWEQVTKQLTGRVRTVVETDSAARLWWPS